jgi:hypothetical protein
MGPDSLEPFLLKTVRVFYGTVIALTLLYQGRLLYFYRGRSAGIAAALEAGGKRG